jgi:RND family efflux transporter MFP subunit
VVVVKKLLLVVLLAACGDPEPPALAPLDTDGGVRDVVPPPSTPDRGFVGVIVAEESVDVAPRFEGVVLRVAVRAGDHVDAGDVVAEMDPAPLREELRAAEAAQRATAAALRQAEVDVAEARRKLEVEKQAVATGTSPRQNLEAAELGLQRAKAAQDRARGALAEERSRVETARARLADATLRAKFAGTVALRYRDAGATVGAGTPIVRIVGQGGMRLRFAVPPDRMRALATGDRVEATIDTIEGTVPATVSQISPSLDPASGYVLVEAELEARTGGELRPGLAAWVKPPA